MWEFEALTPFLFDFFDLCSGIPLDLRRDLDFADAGVAVPGAAGASPSAVSSRCASAIVASSVSGSCSFAETSDDPLVSEGKCKPVGHVDMD